MFRSIVLAASALVVSIPFYSLGQNSTDPVLLEINKSKVKLSEFDAIYNKNNANPQAIDPKTKEEYLDLYVNFKLKVEEAKMLGMDTAAKFINELKGYRAQLSAPYLTDMTITEGLIEEAYNRSKEDVNAYHILVRVDEEASESDRKKALKRIKALKAKIVDPATDFERIARASSEDPSATANGGNLGYFSAFQMVYPFESAAYNTPVGAVSDIVETRFGYHLVYVKDRRPARGEIKTSHIMVRVENANDFDDVELAKGKANEIYGKLQAGEKFEDLAREFSDDKGSAKSGGELPWFGTGRMVPAFEDAAFALKEDGEYSKPVQSRFGWHIIKRIEKKGIPVFAEVKEEIKRKVSRDGRGRKSKESFYANVKSEYGFTFYEKNLQEVAKLIDDDYFVGKWKSEEKAKGKDQPVFTLTDTKYIPENVSYTQKDFAKFLEVNLKFQRQPKTDAKVIVDQLFDIYVKQELTNFENKRLEKKHADFSALMQEYHDGILLFDLMDKKVWSKAVKDTTGLKTYYEANKANYVWPDRVDAIVFSCASKKVAKKAKKYSKKMLNSDWNSDSLLAQVNTESQLDLGIKEEKFVKGDHKVIDQIEWKEGYSSFIEEGEKVKFVYVRKVLPSAPKQLDEARGMFISSYQDHLEKEWINELKKKYTVVIHKELLK